jgi:xylulokinase
VPDGAGVWFGADHGNQTPAHFCRAAMEGATLGLRYGLERLAAQGVKPRELRLTGGGARSGVWRQIVSDVLGVPAIGLVEPESAALGAALQARWCWEHAQGRGMPLERLADAWVRVDESARAVPNVALRAKYDELYEQQCELSIALRSGFTRRRRARVAGS